MYLYNRVNISPNIILNSLYSNNISKDIFYANTYTKLNFTFKIESNSLFEHYMCNTKKTDCVSHRVYLCSRKIVTNCTFKLNTYITTKYGEGHYQTVNMTAVNLQNSNAV